MPALDRLGVGFALLSLTPANMWRSINRTEIDSDCIPGAFATRVVASKRRGSLSGTSVIVQTFRHPLMVNPDTIGPNRIAAPSSALSRWHSGCGTRAGPCHRRVMFTGTPSNARILEPSVDWRIVKKSGGYIQYRRVESSLAVPSQGRSTTDRITLELQFFANDIQ